MYSRYAGGCFDEVKVTYHVHETLIDNIVQVDRTNAVSCQGSKQVTRVKFDAVLLRYVNGWHRNKCIRKKSVMTCHLNHSCLLVFMEEVTILIVVHDAMHLRTEKYLYFPVQILNSNMCQNIYCGIILSTLFSIISVIGCILVISILCL